jgi:hypothetical protein
MSIRTSMLAIAAIAALATTALAPTGAAAFADGGVHFRHLAGHYRFNYAQGYRQYGPPFIPACGHVGCNMKW